ncbi:hypothetical protein KR067_010950, partial [Drosophila pandora]
MVINGLGDQVLPAETAATGDEAEAATPAEKAGTTKGLARTKGRLRMIFRLGAHPSCEFVNGPPP